MATAYATLRVSRDRFAALQLCDGKSCDDNRSYKLRFVLPLHEQGIEVYCTAVRDKFWRFGLVAAIRSAPTKTS